MMFAYPIDKVVLCLSAFKEHSQPASLNFFFRVNKVASFGDIVSFFISVDLTPRYYLLFSDTIALTKRIQGETLMLLIS